VSQGEDFSQRMSRVEGLLAEAERFADQRAQQVTRELVQSLMDLHGAGLARMIELTAQAGADALTDAFADDELVASLLLLYDLHPQGLESRVRQALDAVEPQLSAHSARVEVLSLAESSVRLRLSGCDDHESAQTIARAVEEALCAAAPDLASVEIEGVPPQSRFPLPLLAGEAP
jgi:Fe-S cluster biogenesis protein NfuA